MKPYFRVFITLPSIAILAACASTGPVVKEDLLAREKSQVYIDNSYAVVASGLGGVCAIPAGAEQVRISKTTGPSKDWRELVSRAGVCVAEKNWKMVERIAALIARNDIDSPWGAYFYSLAAESNHDYSRAIWMTDLAQKKAGGRVGIFAYQKGHVLIAMNETVRGLAELERAVKLDATLNEAHLYLASIYQRDQQLDLAGQHFENVLTNDPKNFLALVSLAELQIRLGAGARAADLYQRALAVRGDDLMPYVRLGFIYETMEKSPDRALAQYKNLKASLDRGTIKRGKPEFDLSAKIKTLEQQLAPRIPAQANAADVEGRKRSSK